MSSIIRAIFISCIAITNIFAETLTLTSDSLFYDGKTQQALATGNVTLQSGNTILQSNQLRLDRSQNTSFAEGGVYLKDIHGELWANQMDYDWNIESGDLKNVFIYEKPWRIWARTMHRKPDPKNTLKRVAVTHCDADKPHYHFRSRHANHKPNKRFTLWGPAIVVGKVPVFWFPVWTRSLQDKKWSLRVYPGQSAREGFFTKTRFGYPITPKSYLRLYWDLYEHTGYGLGGQYSYRGVNLNSSFDVYRIDDTLDDRLRWNVRGNHWQRLADKWTMQSRLAFQSDSDVSNLYYEDEDRVRKTTESDLAFTYRNQKYTSRISFEQDQIYSEEQDDFVRYKTVLPSLDFQTTALKFGNDNYFTMSANYKNQYTRPGPSSNEPDPIDPEQDLFQQTANTNFSLWKLLKVKKSATITPRIGFKEEWKSWDIENDVVDEKDSFQGTAFSSINWRQRLGRQWDVNTTYNYNVRLEKNGFSRDYAAIDKGQALHNARLFVWYRPTTRWSYRLQTGYDFTKDRGEVIESSRQKITNPSLEIRGKFLKNWSVFYRHTQDLYPLRIVDSSLFSLDWKKNNDLYVKSGWTYNAFLPGQVQLRHELAFPLSSKWAISGRVIYNLEGTRGTRYNKTTFVERSVTLKRDLHCWKIRVDYRRRLNVDSIYVQLDLNVKPFR